MPDYEIDRVTEQGTLDDLLRPQRTKIVTYHVGKHGPFQVSVPAQGDWDMAAQLLIQADVDRLRRLGLL